MIVYMTIGVVLIFLAFFLGLAVSGTGKDSKKDIIREITKTWRSVDKVGELIELYLIMAIKHGPDSQEATSFRSPRLTWLLTDSNVLGKNKPIR